jgi:hypothetical protein
MENKKIYFKEKQIFYISLIPALIIIGILSFFYFLEIGNEDKKITLAPYLFGVNLFIFIVLVSYNLKILITKNHIYLSFGIGIIKKKISVKDIDINKFEIINIHWCFGIGMRLSNIGTIFNTKQGKGIRLKMKSNEKSFIIVSKRIEEIRETILKINKENTFDNK